MDTVSTGRITYSARVERILNHAPDVRSLFLRSADQSMPAFVPGMFISISMPLGNEVRVRPYTIASSPEDRDRFEIVFDRVPHGRGAAWMFERSVGDEIGFTGPFGAFTLDQIPATPLAFIAEGTGIAPIRPMINRVLGRDPDHEVELLYAADREEHLLYRAELEARIRGCGRATFTPIVASGGLDKLYSELLGRVQRQWIDNDSNRARQFYICGVGAGVLALRDLLRNAGYERRAVRYERW